jgi:solute carrier family 35, member E3
MADSKSSAKLWLLINFACSVGIVFLNKFIFNNLLFGFGITLSVLHFVVTSAGLAVAFFALNLFEHKRLKVWGDPTLFLLAAAFAFSVPFCNLSIRSNTLGTYQVSKSFTTPLTVLIQTVAFNKRYGLSVLLSIALISVGVFVTAATDMQFSLDGFAFASMCVVATVLAQIYIKRKQVELGASPVQLMLYVVPLASVIESTTIPMLDDVSALVAYEFTPFNVAVIVGSGVLALLVNISLFRAIGATSAVTYQVIGYAKFAVIIAGSFLLFDQAVDTNNLIGIAITLLGVILYGYFVNNSSSDSSNDQKDKDKDK